MISFLGDHGNGGSYRSSIWTHAAAGAEARMIWMHNGRVVLPGMIEPVGSLR
jgi:hypothetical protein